MRSVVVVFTLDFPDPLLGIEIPYLAKSFDKVYILPNRTGEITGVPANVEIVSLFKAVNLKKPWAPILKNFWRVLRIYSYSVVQPGNFLPYIKYYRSFLGHLLEETEKINVIKDFVKEHNLKDALFYDYWFVNSLLALAELKRQGVIKHIVSRAHGFDLYDERQFEGRVPFREYKVRWSDGIFTISNHGFQYLKAKLSRRLQSKVYLSYLGVDNPFQEKVLSEFNTTQFTIVSCARMVSLKRISLLAEVLSRTSLPIHWIHFGDGPERKKVEEVITTIPRTCKVTLMGECSNEEVLKFYAKNYVSLFVSLSETEGLPVSMMEAISAGIPIMAISVNGIPEIVTPITGVLIQDIDTPSDQLAKILEETLLHASFDRNAIRNFFNQNFSADSNTNAFIKNLRMLTDSDASTVPVQYQQCTQCVLDTLDDPGIMFDAKGVCTYCHQYELDAKSLLKQGREGEEFLQQIIGKIKKEGRGQKYDCILGISGGVDSTYLAYQAKKFGLKPLAVHFDNGWNSELAVKNIENIVNRLNLPLHTLVVDWDEFKDLQLAFLKASVIDIELATDHAMLATLYKLAVENNIRYILSGHNVVTEAVLPKNWYHDKRDHLHIKAINRLFGEKKLKTYPLLTSWIKLQVVWRRIESISLLNYMDYNKAQIKDFIAKELGWRDYGGKHFESVFTRFYQGYILRKKFGIDKRKAHLSNLICSGQISRETALLELIEEPYSKEMQQQDYEYALKKFQITRQEFEEIMSRPVRKHNQYPVDRSIYDRFLFLKVFRPGWKAFKKVRQFVKPS